MSDSPERTAGPQGPAIAFRQQATEQHFCFPVRLGRAVRRDYLLDGTIFRPAGDGPYPLVVINHGMPFAGDFHSLPRYRFSTVAGWFVEHGFAVAVPMRRGYGASDGDCVEGVGNPDDPDFFWAGQSTANDIGAVIAYLRTLPFVQPEQVIVLGQSAGAWGALALAGRNQAGIAATIAVAPGRGGLCPGVNSHPERLIQTAARFGAQVCTPVLWLSCVNDRIFPCSLSRQMFDAFAERHELSSFIALPAYGEDGHQMIKEPGGLALWGQPVEFFLREHSLWPSDQGNPGHDSSQD